MQNNIVLIAKNRISLIIFLLLLIWRFVDYPLFEFLKDSQFSHFQKTYVFAHSFCDYIFVALIIWVNKSDLISLKISKSYFYIFIFSGVLLSFIYYSGFLSLSILLLVVYFLYDNRKEPYQFLEHKKTKLRNLIVPMLVLWLPIYLYLWFKFSFRSPSLTFYEAFWRAIFQTDLSAIAVEEFMFRGMVWMYLEKKGYSEKRILYSQAFLFWLAHYYYHITNPAFFWIVIPIYSILLGVLVLRSKSLTPSTIAHYVINFGRGFI